MALLGLIGSAIKPVTDLVDGLHTSDEERLKLKNEIVSLQLGLQSQIIDYEQKALAGRQKIILAEAKSTHWLTSTWRPITMLSFVATSVGALWWNHIIQPMFVPDLPPIEIPEDMWTLMKLGLGGYVVGRSAEKIVEKVRATSP